MNMKPVSVLVYEHCSINLKYATAIVYRLYLSAGVHLERQIKSLFLNLLTWM